MPGRIRVRGARPPLFSFPAFALFAAGAALFLFFGFVTALALGVAGIAVSVLRKLLGGGKRPRTDGPGDGTVVLDEDDYEIRDAGRR